MKPIHVVIVALLLFMTACSYPAPLDTAVKNKALFVAYGDSYNNTGEFLADTLFIRSALDLSEWKREEISMLTLNSYKRSCLVENSKLRCTDALEKEITAAFPNFSIAIVISRQNFTTYLEGNKLYFSIPSIIETEQVQEKQAELIPLLDKMHQQWLGSG